MTETTFQSDPDKPLCLLTAGLFVFWAGRKRDFNQG